MAPPMDFQLAPARRLITVFRKRSDAHAASAIRPSTTSTGHPTRSKSLPHAHRNAPSQIRKGPGSTGRMEPARPRKSRTTPNPLSSKPYASAISRAAYGRIACVASRWSPAPSSTCRGSTVSGCKERLDLQAQVRVQLGRHADVGKVEVSAGGASRLDQETALGQRQRHGGCGADVGVVEPALGRVQPAWRIQAEHGRCRAVGEPDQVAGHAARIAAQTVADHGVDDQITGRQFPAVVRPGQGHAHRLQDG